MLSVFKGHVKRMLREEMRELIAVVPSNGMSMTEQRMQRLENIAGRAIVNVTPAMLVQFANSREVLTQWFHDARPSEKSPNLDI